MSVKKEFEKIDEELCHLEKDRASLHHKKCDLEEKRNDLLSDYLLEESILAQYPWNIAGETRWLELECTRRASEWKVLADLAETNYHCYKEIEKGINLHFNDGRIHISFAKGAPQIAAFIKKFKINLGSSTIDDRYKMLKKELVALEEVHKLLHGK